MNIKESTIKNHILGHGLEDQGYEHLRSSSNETYLLEQDDYILRFRYIGDPDENFDLMKNTSYQPYRSIILWNMLRNTVPAVNQIADFHDGWMSTLWYRGKTLDDKSGMYISQALYKLHNMDKNTVQDSLNLSRMNIINTINSRYEKVEESNIDNEIKDYLKSMIDKSQMIHDKIAFSGNETLHLDAYGGNVIEYKENPCFIDLDTLSLGPWQYDYVVLFVSSQLFGDCLDISYIPKNVFSWEMYDMSVHLRKTDMFSWSCVMSDNSDRHYKEMIKRYESIRYGREYIWDKTL